MYTKKKGEIRPRPMANLYSQKMRVKREHKDATTNFDYTTIADRLRMVSWHYNCHLTVWYIGERNPNLSAKTEQLSNEKDTHLNICK